MTEEKNIAIAEMLGWKFLSTMPENVITDLKKEHHSLHNLKFHLDANWQFEALKKTMVYTLMKKGSTFNDKWFVCTIKEYNETTGNKIFIAEGVDENEAIFEALYQFSQYIKSL